MSVEPVIVVQGGAGVFCTIVYDPRTVDGIEEAVVEAARRGYKHLVGGGSALDAVQATVMYQEEHPTFNTGVGSCLTVDGRVEMDASIMDGNTLATGAVACVSNVFHPVQLARLVMEKTDHVLLAGEGADRFAVSQGMRIASQQELVTERSRKRLQYLSTFSPMTEEFATALANAGKPQDDTHDTVGAVAIDRNGNVAFATSSGGRNAQMSGRVGDSPIIGSGGYADNRCGAVSTTGEGEAFIKLCSAKEISSLMKQGVAPTDAIGQCLDEMKERLGGLGGAIAINSAGEIGINYNTPGMSWAAIKANKITYGIYKGDLKEMAYH